jgi:hypothetical protein
MKDAPPSAPHFLRVVRALARVRGAAIPLAAVTTVVAGVACGAKNGIVAGVEIMDDGGTGGDTTTSSTTGVASSGVSVMPDSGTSSSSGGFAGMPDGGDGGP